MAGMKPPDNRNIQYFSCPVLPKTGLPPALSKILKNPAAVFSDYYTVFARQ